MPSNGYKCPDSSEQDPILKILDKYKGHPSIKLIKAKNNSQVFKFSHTDTEKVKKSFQKPWPEKCSTKGYYQNQSTEEKCRHFCQIHMWWHQWFNSFFKISQRTETSRHCTYT